LHKLLKVSSRSEMNSLWFLVLTITPST
jgi:hypothetical protein